MTSNHKKFRLNRILIPLMTVGVIFEAQSGQLSSTLGSIGAMGVNRVLENFGFSGSSDSNLADAVFLATNSDESNSVNLQGGVSNNAEAGGWVKRNGANGANVRNVNALAAATVTGGAGSGGQGGDAAGSSGASRGGGNASAIIPATDSSSRLIFVSAHPLDGSSVNSYGGNGGNGSKVASSVIVSADNSYLLVSNTATGGNGGDVYSGSGNGGRGGSASSSAIASNIGAQSVYVFSTANGGAGGVAHGSGSNGVGGNATAYASATSSDGYAYAYSTANGGRGLTVPIINAHAVSKGGAGSQANAVAIATGIKVHAQTKVNNTSGTSDAIATIMQPAIAASSAVGKEAAAYGTALPQLADVSTALEGQSTVKHYFDLDGNSQIWLLGNMSVLNTSIIEGLHDYHSMLNFNIDTTSISNPQHVLIGLLDPLFGNNSFLNGNGDSLTFSYSISGAGANRSKTYAFNSADANDAADFFSDRILDLGPLSGFVTSNNKYLNLVFNLDLQTSLTGAGLNLGLIAGNSSLGGGSVAPVPLPGSFWLLGSAIAGMGFINRRYLRLPWKVKLRTSLYQV
ncbi:MAG: hypothetical protein EPO18_00065 [Methylobacter sp.]|nr:MAG: hypothetical protein EPO18_00065 [Methylobacter sp.]